jgi:DNA polymerase
MDELELDYETYSERDLKVVGLDNYSAAAEVMLAAYRFNGGPVRLWDYHDGEPLPRDLAEALADPHVRKWAFNAQFERVITNAALGIYSPVKNWRCTMVLAYMQAFTGGLADVGRQMQVKDDLRKMQAEGKALVRLFCGPQKVTAKQPHVRRSALTDPDKWDTFRDYCIRDVVAEGSIRRPLLRYPIPEAEWELYEIDQIINDRGKPVNVQFVRNALDMAERRREELLVEMRRITRLANPNSQAQFLGWLKENGYSFSDIGKDTVTKSLREDPLTDVAKEALRLRQWAARMSVKKHKAILDCVGEDGNLRYLYQFAGASRTNRWAGRKVQTQNLPRTPKVIENEFSLEYATDMIHRGAYDSIKQAFAEPMEIIVGTVRSAFGNIDGSHGDGEFRVNDLSSIESVVLGYVARSKRILNVFHNGLDIYKDFGTVWLRKPYDQLSKFERNLCKPATLGAGYRLSGGDIITEGKNAGKKSGLWGYAENMGIFMEREQAHDSVRVFREDWAPEVPVLWKAYETASRICLMTGKPQKVGPVTFEYMKPYMTIRLPSGRRMFYYKPRIETITVKPKKGDPYTRKTLTYMGVSQVTKKWQRIPTHGGKLTENIVQAFARDVLAEGIRRAHKAGFILRGHVHDEVIAWQGVTDTLYTNDALAKCMTDPIPWAPDLPLKAAGWSGLFYRKD